MSTDCMRRRVRRLQYPKGGPLAAGVLRSVSSVWSPWLSGRALMACNCICNGSWRGNKGPRGNAPLLAAVLGVRVRVFA